MTELPFGGRAVPLVPFPGKPHPKIAITVEATRLSAGRLRLWYVVKGAVEGLVMPPLGQAAREDGLWHHSCCEAFVRAGAGAAYRELNLSPSGKWAAYDFASYRKGGANAAMRPPMITTAAVAGQFAVGADLHFDGAAAAAAWHIGLSMVVEAKGGAKSYWALAHAADKPDFHRPESFTLTLPATR
ncbi:DOMON-like domain-containing protein [Sphingomonas sp. LB-2]|uniref:DOMON-like domain-containing protein n=1 Tax=Sphingomonas caeni TaxID=2984949 RepID=UPI0022315676|nr:DOMON-like domain-containing protein [Sphingomonas caeni]MCW3847627.1 DOMON-like domain-containing protein [Sphingomonas caeni]